jgi:Fe2+ transport system protein FeoA
MSVVLGESEANTMIRLQSLATAEAGRDFLIRAIQVGNPRQCRRLRELGLLEGRIVRVLARRDPLICLVGDCRLGLCRRLASGILVEAVGGRQACDHEN